MRITHCGAGALRAGGALRQAASGGGAGSGCSGAAARQTGLVATHDMPASTSLRLAADLGVQLSRPPAGSRRAPRIHGHLLRRTARRGRPPPADGCALMGQGGGGSGLVTA
jgi:hypothetical protein